MPYDTVPTFESGQIVTAGQMNIIRGNVLWLLGQATLPIAPQRELKQLTANADVAWTVFGYAMGRHQLSQETLRLAGRINNEQGAGTISVKATLKRQGVADVVLTTQTQTGYGTTDFDLSINMSALSLVSGEFLRIEFAYEVTGGAGGLLSYARIWHAAETGRGVGTYVTPPAWVDGTTVITHTLLNQYGSALGGLLLAATSPETGFRMLYATDKRNTTEEEIGRHYWYHRPGCQSLYVNCEVGLSQRKAGVASRCKVYIEKPDSSQVLITGNTLTYPTAAVKDEKFLRYAQEFSLAAASLVNNTRYAVVVKHVVPGGHASTGPTGYVKVFNVYETGDGPTGYAEPGEWGGKQPFYGDTAGQSTRAQLLTDDIKLLAGDAGAGYVEADSPLVYRNYMNLIPVKPDEWLYFGKRMQFVRHPEYTVLRYRTKGATLYWGDMDAPDSQKLDDYPGEVDGLRYRTLLLDGITTLVPGTEFWVACETGEIAYVSVERA